VVFLRSPAVACGFQADRKKRRLTVNLYVPFTRATQRSHE